MPTYSRYPCERCGAEVVRQVGDEGKGRFCSIRCGRAAQVAPNREVRFWAKVAKGDGCWEWTGHRNANGYGLLYTGPRGSVRGELAHRVSWEIAYEVIPDGLHVCHRCDNPPCVRPDHLFVGTDKDNMRDRDMKGRQISPKGEAVKNARLTEAIVREIRVKRKSGALLRELAVEYDVSLPTIEGVCTRRTWAHVE